MANTHKKKSHFREIKKTERRFWVLAVLLVFASIFFSMLAYGRLVHAVSSTIQLGGADR